ncbi:MAG: 5'/3'-nucleotidase SurE [Armatimonadetes bacterium]|nr:5'/3'-nucleotidase SurE [Armatimonadota bacterium]
MHFLLTNDDGVFSDGLNALIKELKKIATLTVIAPDRERSAIGHSVTFFYPLRIQKIKKEKKCIIYSSDGTPSDCVLLGIYDLMPRKPDLVISGINHGGNLGYDITYSGTVSAAMEALIHKIPSFAVSLAGSENLNFEYAAYFSRKLAKEVLKKGMPEGVFLNLNIPNVPKDEIKGVEITFQGTSFYDQKFIKRMDPRGSEYYWLTGAVPTGELLGGSDYKAVYENKISITPIQLNMTNLNLISFFKGWKII